MIISIILGLCNMMNTYSFVLRSTNNLMMKNSVDYKVDMVIYDEDYELIHSKELKNFTIDDKMFEELDKIARLEYNKKTPTLDDYTPNLYARMETSTMPIIVVTINDWVYTTYMMPVRFNSNKKREALKGNNMEYATEYKYNDLLREYNDEAQDDIELTLGEVVKLFFDLQFSESDANRLGVTETPQYGVVKSLKLIFLPQNENNNYNKSIGLEAIKALVEDCRSQRRITLNAAARFWRIIQIWFLVYLTIAVPLWCTRGWCCCCLFCKFFKPRQTIEEAKRYVSSNPPGIFHTKTGQILYDPTEREKETYEEFEHFIKTL